ncbi:MAG: metallophosphoesterase [Chitinophagaceae bacterium]
MIAKIVTILAFLCCSVSLQAQDSIKYRILFIGDAGEINSTQKTIIQQAAALSIPGKTSAVYLGDNIYPRGMGLPGSAEENSTKEILQSQYLPMRARNTPVYFVPGNHDWDRSGPLGLAKIKAQSDFLQLQNDSGLHAAPANGCPDPVAIPLTPMLTLIAWDSEWWLYPYAKDTGTEGCTCKTQKDVVAKLELLRDNNRGKIILLASHHPFKSYGEHAGHFTLKDHLFPLTAINGKLLIPLPVLGSLYPVLRNIFPLAEDLKNPVYQNMIREVSGVFKDFPNIAYIAGHEHGLQLIKNERLQIVSGAGAKHTNAKRGKGSLFADATQGFVTADLLANNQLRFSFFIAVKDSVRLAYSYEMPKTATR